MIQGIAVTVLFVGALVYLGQRLFRSSDGTEAGCEGCAVNQMAAAKPTKARQERA